MARCLGGLAVSAEDKDAVRVLGGLAFSEFRGYEVMEVIAMSANAKVVAVTVGDPAMIEAYGPAFPPTASRSRTAPRWPRSIGCRNRTVLQRATVPGSLVNVDFMVKDSKRFADGGGWGYAVFDYDAATDSFKPGTKAGTPPQRTTRNVAWRPHASEGDRLVFTEYGKR